MRWPSGKALGTGVDASAGPAGVALALPAVIRPVASRAHDAARARPRVRDVRWDMRFLLVGITGAGLTGASAPAGPPLPLSLVIWGFVPSGFRKTFAVGAR